MFRKKLKNYLELSDVRISYDENDDSVHITGKDKNAPRYLDDVSLKLDGDGSAESTLRYMLQEAGIITDDHYIPCEMSYDDIAESSWDVFPLGKARGTMIANWAPNNSAHLLISGSVSSGKSVIEQNLVFHCLKHPDKWRVWGIDLAQWELSKLAKKYAPVVEHMATDIEAALEICRAALDEMTDRQDKMKALGVNSYRDLPDAPTAIMVMVSELSSLFGNHGSRMPIDVSKEELQDEFSMILTKISESGGAAGIHLVLSRWDEEGTPYSFVSEQLKDNLTSKIHLGKSAPAEAVMLTGDPEAVKINWMRWAGGRIRGRGYITHRGQKGQEFQVAYSDDNWYDEWLKKNPRRKTLGSRTK